MFQIHILKDSGELKSVTLGDVVRNEDCVAQVVVPHDTWYSAELVQDAPYSLYSAVVIPGKYNNTGLFRDLLVGMTSVQTLLLLLYCICIHALNINHVW